MEVAEGNPQVLKQKPASSDFKILVFAGHSGGHLFPAQAFAEGFHKSHPESSLYLVTSRKGKNLVGKIPPKLFREVFYLKEFPFPAGISLRSLFFLLQLPGAFLASSKILFHLKPDACIGFGSYVSFPGMHLAALLRIPTLIHEQNRIPGKATRILASRVDRVAVSFEETFSNAKLRGRYVTGLPLRAQLCENAKNTGRTGKEKFCLLVVGGSQGAHRLNELILDALNGLNSEEKKKIAVIHIAGTNDHAWVGESYKKMEITSDVFPFSEKMQELYQRADMAVTRAGANTLFELSLFRLPAIVVPYPYAESHQAANAVYFESRQAVLCKPEDTLSAEGLRQEILRLMNNPEDCEQLSQKIGEFSPAEAGKRLVDLTEDLIAKAQKTHAHR